MTQPEPLPDPSTVTELLQGVREGEPGAAASLMPLVHDQVRGLAALGFTNVRREPTLEPTALIHEAWLKLSGHTGCIEDREHFFILDDAWRVT